MKYIFFFATPADIGPVLRMFESHAALKFVDPDIRSTPNRDFYLASAEIPSVGLSSHETGSGSRTYVVSHRHIKNRVHQFVDNNGKKRWMVNNGDNDDTVMLTPAGLWRTGTLLPGNMSTLHQTPAAQQLMRWFLSALQDQDFQKVHLWWLGREALGMLRSGRRLTTTGEQSPPEFDLKLPDHLR